MTRDLVYVIAEGGVNHDGDVGDALRLVEAAARAGADAVKFQTFRTDALTASSAPKAGYQRRSTDPGESQSAMLRRLELSHDAHREILAASVELGIDFLSTPFDPWSLAFLVEDLGLRRIKIGSGDLTNGPLLHQAAQRGVDVILSTGLATLGEIEEALGALALGYAGEVPRCRSDLLRAWSDAALRAGLTGRVVLLQCTTEYPAPPASANLRAIDTLSAAFGLPVGFSDHTEGRDVCVAAVACGARTIEKHITLDRNRPGPDHAASMEPEDFAALVSAIRTVEVSLGDGRKTPHPSEAANALAARKSLVAGAPIRAHEPFSAVNLLAKRPGLGRSPNDMWDIIGLPSKRSYARDEAIDP